MIRKLNKKQEEELEALRLKQRSRDITAKELLIKIERLGERSSLYRLFEWDDTKAAQTFREIQAGEVLRAVPFKITVSKAKKVDVRKYYTVVKGNRRAYNHVTDIMKSRKLSDQLKHQAVVDFLAWRKKYLNLFGEAFVLSVTHGEHHLEAAE